MRGVFDLLWHHTALFCTVLHRFALRRQFHCRYFSDNSSHPGATQRKFL